MLCLTSMHEVIQCGVAAALEVQYRRFSTVFGCKYKMKQMEQANRSSSVVLQQPRRCSTKGFPLSMVVDTKCGRQNRQTAKYTCVRAGHVSGLGMCQGWACVLCSYYSWWMTRHTVSCSELMGMRAAFRRASLSFCPCSARQFARHHAQKLHQSLSACATV